MEIKDRELRDVNDKFRSMPIGVDWQIIRIKRNHLADKKLRRANINSR